MNYPATSVQLALLAGAGALWVTLPDGPIPDIFWRLHFGGAMWMFGAMLGVGVGLWMGSRRAGRAGDAWK